MYGEEQEEEGGDKRGVGDPGKAYTFYNIVPSCPRFRTPLLRH